jgi:hypothetical protein
MSFLYNIYILYSPNEGDHDRGISLAHEANGGEEQGLRQQQVGIARQEDHARGRVSGLEPVPGFVFEQGERRERKAVA